MGCGNDATPPTVFSCISQLGLEATTCLLGREQVRETLFVRLPKTEGGSRLIGLMSTSARWWSRARHMYAADWEKEPNNGMFWERRSKNRSCTDAAFGQTVSWHSRWRPRSVDACRPNQVLRDSHPCRDLKRSTYHTSAPACRMALSRHVWRQKKDLRPR